MSSALCARSSTVALVAALSVSVFALPNALLAQQELPESGPYASVDFPPAGQRLRDLAARLPIEIGFAARRDWPQLPEAAAYEAIAKAEFGILTPESSFKWQFVHPFEGQFDFADLDREVAFATANDMLLHGHPLTWYLLNPPWLDAVPAERLPAVLESHVTTVVSRYAGKFAVWDVVNEGLNNDGSALRDDIWTNALGTTYMDIAFDAARAADPAATLIYNDYDIGWLTAKSARALSLVDELLAREVPVDGIGMQMHLDHTFNHFEGHSEAMQRFADRGLDIFITELDVGVLQIEDYLIQADVYEETVRRCLMQPACKAVQIWGLNDRTSWRPFFRPLPYDEVTRVKPAYFGLQRGLMSQPVHPEQCTLDQGRVISGSVYSEGERGESFGVRCADVPLEGGFTTLSVRYRNPGTDTPKLRVTAGAMELATVALVPTAPSNDGEFRTLDVSVLALDSATTLEVTVEAVSDGADVGVDALLFSEPTRPLTVSPGGATTGEATTGGATTGAATTAGATTAAGTTAGNTSGGAATSGTTSGTPTAGGSSSAGGEGGISDDGTVDTGATTGGSDSTGGDAGATTGVTDSGFGSSGSTSGGSGSSSGGFGSAGPLTLFLLALPLFASGRRRRPDAGIRTP